MIRKAKTDAGEAVKIIAPKVGGEKLSTSPMLAADEQMAGTPSVLFDTLAVILTDEGAKALADERDGCTFVRDAFGHLKVIAVDNGGQALLRTVNIPQNAGVINADDKNALSPRQKPANGTGESQFEH